MPKKDKKKRERNTPRQRKASARRRQKAKTAIVIPRMPPRGSGNFSMEEVSSWESDGDSAVGSEMNALQDKVLEVNRRMEDLRRKNPFRHVHGDAAHLGNDPNDSAVSVSSSNHNHHNKDDNHAKDWSTFIASSFALSNDSDSDENAEPCPARAAPLAATQVDRKRSAIAKELARLIEDAESGDAVTQLHARSPPSPPPSPYAGEQPQPQPSQHRPHASLAPAASLSQVLLERTRNQSTQRRGSSAPAVAAGTPNGAASSRASSGTRSLGTRRLQINTQDRQSDLSLFHDA